MPITLPIRAMFFPKKPVSMDFTAAIDALKMQQMARITKAALFALATLALTAVVVLSEASMIAWPIFLPVVIVTLVAGFLFYRLNSLDDQYISGLDGNLRASLAKEEIDKLFCQRPSRELKKEEIESTLQNINTLVGHEIFCATFRKKVIDAHESCDGEKTLAEFFEAKNIPFHIEGKREWEEKGRFGLSSYTRAIDIKWNGKKSDSIHVTCRYEPKKIEE